jgi:hypothetical protein
MPDIIFYLFFSALGFAGGYGVRDYVSRKRRREPPLAVDSFDYDR